MQWRDRPWVQSYVTVLCGPFAMPSVCEIRRAVQALADRYPRSRLTWSVGPDGVSWRNDRHVDDVVIARRWPDLTDPADVLDMMARDASMLPPLTLVRYPDYLGLKMSHGLGDGRIFLSVLSAVLRTAIAGEVCEWLPENARRPPLADAVLGTFGRRPMLIRRAMSDRLDGCPAAGQQCADIGPWTPSRRTVHVALPRGAADELIGWGKRHAPAASRFALQVTLILRAMRRVGLDIAADTRVIVDLRRYLGWRYVDGNFVAGVPMALHAGMSAEELSTTIRTTMMSGRPLANQLATLLHQRGSLTVPPVDSFDRNGLPQVAFTNMGRSPEIECLPFTTGPRPVYAGSVPPAGPHGITVLLGENPQVMSMNATFHDNVVDAELVRAALKEAAAHPIELLAEPVR